jgi:hypothetical protein
MRLLTLVLASMSFVIASIDLASAQVGQGKRDIKGFSLGMPIGEASPKLKSMSWTEQVNASDPRNCQLKNFQPGPLDDVSGALRGVYGGMLRGDCANGEILSLILAPDLNVVMGIAYQWNSPREFEDISAAVATQFGVEKEKKGGVYGFAEWPLASGIVLRLQRSPWKLVLIDRNIAAADERARTQRVNRTAPPNPKF